MCGRISKQMPLIIQADKHTHTLTHTHTHTNSVLLIL